MQLSEQDVSAGRATCGGAAHGRSGAAVDRRHLAKGSVFDPSLPEKAEAAGSPVSDSRITSS